MTYRHLLHKSFHALATFMPLTADPLKCFLHEVSCPLASTDSLTTSLFLISRAPEAPKYHFWHLRRPDEQRVIQPIPRPPRRIAVVPPA